MLIIKTNEELRDLADLLRHEIKIAVDTEFMRRHTYFAVLALIQIATPANTYIIDPLQVNISILKSIFESNDIIKVFHAPQQDLNILYHQFKIFTKNIFDTQIAAKLCNLHYQISYRHLCQLLLNIEIDKSLQDQDWTVRPLPDKMLNYAAQDAALLLPLYDIMLKELKAYHNIDKTVKLMANFSEKSYYAADYANLWQKIKFNHRSPRFIETVQMLAALREHMAIKSNIPRQHVISDEHLIILANQLPTSTHQLNRLNIRHRFSVEQIEELFDLCLGLQEGI